MRLRPRDRAVAGSVGDGPSALREADRLHPDVILLDFLMPGMNGLEVTNALLAADPSRKILILTTFGEAEGIRRALAAGARGAVLKSIPFDDLVAAVRTVAGGGTHVSPEIRQIIEEEKPLSALSPRQREILQSVSHGLTPSNSYLFAWHNCCVERCATNRVDASIELFRNGAMATTVTPLSTPTPPTYTYYPPTLPEGVFGVGQDEAWIRANFPDEADHILAMGYENWLLNEYVGIDEENGHYLVRVTIDPSAFDQPPATNNQPPIYLSCGPYKVNVAEPGTYAFPLEVFEEYEAKAYPTSVPLAFEYDDGYRGEGGPSFEIVEVTEHPRLMMAAPALNQPPITNNQPLSCIYRFFMRPKVVVTPNRVSLDEAVGKVINLWVNVTNTVERSWSSFAYNTRLSFTRNQAVIDEARVAELARILLEHDRRIASGELVITPLPIDESQLETNRFDVTIFEGETWHTAETNDLYVKYFTVPTEVGTTNLVLDTNVYGPPAGRSVYIGVFMASAEDMGNIADCCDDRISWNVQVNGMSVLSGETSAYAHHDTLYAMALETHRLYGIEWPLILLGGCQVDPPNGDDYGIRLIGTAQNAGDGLRQTCLQIGIFPIDDNGVVVGWPSWAQR